LGSRCWTRFLVSGLCLFFAAPGYGRQAAADSQPAQKVTVASGLGIEFPQGDQLGVGAGWGRPAERALRDQYTAEVFYRLQVTSDFAVTPNVQVIFDPAANPAESSIDVYSLRARISL